MCPPMMYEKLSLTLSINPAVKALSRVIIMTPKAMALSQQEAALLLASGITKSDTHGCHHVAIHLEGAEPLALHSFNGLNFQGDGNGIEAGHDADHGYGDEGHHDRAMKASV